jgi:outer membrane lipoprotein-sorting protein
MNLRLPLTLAALALIPSTLPAQNSPALKPLIAQLNASSRNFRSAQADVRYDNYTYVVRAHDISTGSIYIERKGSAVTMGAVIFDDGAKSPSKILSFNGNTFEMYTPGVNQIDVFKAGANQAKYESFLTLGFGGSGTALNDAWKIKDLGTETIDGVATRKLDLTSNDPSVSNVFSHITIWLDPTRDVSLKQMFFAPNGDTRTTFYTNIKLNSHIDTAPYDINKLGKKATRIKH